MKPKSTLSHFLASICGSLLPFSIAHASTLYWDANGVTAGQTDGAGTWLSTNQWWNGSANTTWASGDAAVFGLGGAGGAVSLASPTTLESLTLGFYTGTYTLGTAGQAITLNNGINKFGGQTGDVTISSPLILAGAQTWTNNSIGAINLGGATTLSGNLTIDGSGIINSVATAAAIGGTGNIIKNGTGQFNFSAGGTAPTHTFTGDIVVNGGSIGFQDSSVLTGRNVHLTDGYLGGRSTSGFTWTGGLGTGANQIRITGGTSGLSGEGSASSAFQIGAGGSTLIWGASGEGSATGYFNPTVLLLNGNHRMNSTGKGSLNNAIDLNGTTRTITSTQVTDGASTSGFTVSGAITTSSGTAGLVKTGTGNLILTADNTYNGATTIRSDNAYSTTTAPYLVTAPGSITLSGANGRISNTSALNLTAGGTLRMVSTNAQNTVDRLNSAAIAVSGGGGLWWENTAGANSFAETVGNVTVNSGTFNVNLTTNQTAAGSQTLTLGSLTRNGTSSVAFSAGGTGPQVSGNKNMIVVSGSGTTTPGEIIGSWATTGTAPNAQTDYAVYTSNHVTSLANAASAQSSWSTTHAATSNYTLSNASGTSADGRLTATRKINTLRNTTALGGSASFNASSDVVTLTGNSFADGDVVLLGSSVNGLTFGVPYFVRDKSGDTFKLALTSGGTAVDITAATATTITGGLTLGANNLGTFGILNGSATPLVIGGSTGSITLPTAGAGQLHINTGAGAINNNAPIIDNGGALTLVKSGNPAVNITNNNYSTQGTLVLNGVNTYTGDTIINGGTLRIGTNAFTNGASLGGAGGNYAGNIQINGGGLLYVSTNAAQNYSGVISGDGSLMKTHNGTLTLSGANTYTGRTSISPTTTTGAGVLVVSSFNSVNGGTPLLASSSLGAPTTVANGTIDLGGPANIQGSATLRYTGSGETTDRVINIRFGSATDRTIETNGTGLLKFTSPFTFENIGQATGTNVRLQGTGNGEIVGGLPSAGGYAVIKSGSGTWTIGGPVGSTNKFEVSAGTLVATHTQALGAAIGNGVASGPTIGGSGTISLRNNSNVTFGVAGTGYNINNSASGATINVDRVSGTGSNTLTAGNLTTTSVATTWQLNFTGANGVSLNAGTLTTPTAALGANTISNSITGGGSLTLAGITGGGTGATSSLNFNGNGNTTVTGAITQTATAQSLTKNGTGTLRLNGTSTYTGTTTVSAGVLAVNGSLANTTTTVSSATSSRLQGSGSIGGSVTVGSNGTLAAGNSIESLGVGSLSLTNGSTFEHEIFDNSSTGADLVYSSGDLSLTGTVTLSLLDLGTYLWQVNDKLTLISYTGTLTANSLFSYADGNDGLLADGEIFTFDGVQWVFDYDDTLEGTNYTGDSAGTFVTMTVVPEPRAALLGGLGLLMLLRRRR
jgi:fibronectin-binding autotransporter adhesin